MKEKIIVALDVDDLALAKKIVDQLPEAECFKVGLQAYIKFGEKIIGYIKKKKKKLFLDLKFKDIPNTVAGAIESSVKYSPAFLTIHLSGGSDMIQKAVEAAECHQGLILLGVTVLTSLGNKDLFKMGISLSLTDTVINLCLLGMESGMNAFVCSPLEVAMIRKKLGDKIILVTPGVRPSWAESQDHKRIMTPREAVLAGSNFLVIGRPITHAQSPADAFSRIADEISD